MLVKGAPGKKVSGVALYTPVKHPDSKVRGANMGPTWGQQDPGGPHVGPTNLAIRMVIRFFLRQIIHGVFILIFMPSSPPQPCIGWDIKMMSHPNSNAGFINIWDCLICQWSPNLTRLSKLVAAPNWCRTLHNYADGPQFLLILFSNVFHNRCNISARN